MQVGFFKIHPEIPSNLSLAARSFILSCFEPDPQKRVTAADLLRDVFLRQVNKGKKSRIASRPSGEVYWDSWVTPRPQAPLLLKEFQLSRVLNFPHGIHFCGVGGGDCRGVGVAVLGHQNPTNECHSISQWRCTGAPQVTAMPPPPTFVKIFPLWHEVRGALA